MAIASTGGLAYITNAGGGGDISLSGNTSGTLALISSGTLYLAGGNNVTLSQHGNSISISAEHHCGQTLSISAGTTSSGYPE